MAQLVKNIDGESIEVTDINGAIDECEKFLGFSEEGSREFKYWSYLLNEVKKLTHEPVVVSVEIVEIDGVTLSESVVECRKKFLGFNIGKGFIKDDKTSPVYSAISCAKSPNKLIELDMLKIGENTHNSTPRKITRVF